MERGTFYENNIVLCNDATYNEIVRSDEKLISLIQYDRDEKSVEIGHFSKVYKEFII
ncbi:MAG: hypothetical protein AB2417_03060 [Clostridiaceae bacterium]